MPGEGGLTFEGSPEREPASRENPAKPAADEPTESSESDARTNGGSATAGGTSAPVPSASVGTGTGTGTDPGTGTDSDEIGGISTPPDDEEMPLADHVEEMISRLAIVVLVGAGGTAIGLLWATGAIDIIWGRAIPQAEAWRPHLYGPLELWLTRIKVASLLGIMIALPVFVYETYLFMRPGLYPHERKYYLAAVPTSVILAGIGMLFSYLLVLPVLFEYFSYYSRESAAIKYALGTTFDLIITLTAFLAIVFQIPLFIMLAVMMGVTTRQWLADKRLYFWVAFAGLAFTFTIDPSGMAAGLVAITMIVLYEGTLLILKWTGVD
ncbi:twin-arginine translocase subunit TatC [Halovivax cerinus]|uniref:Sec-independent protein translocase protein TatC n=1 Tax=Halovivax cerinus TaxID=1487865 RepID=A0ABD5NRV5_9EURY|nr:twin-arginine translocase subunit TatC [Halovivax cerinus]